MNQKVCIQRMFMSLIFSVMYLLSFAQTRQISGMVKDMSGEPVIYGAQNETYIED